MMTWFNDQISWGQHCPGLALSPPQLGFTSHLISFVHQGLEGCEQSPIGTHCHQHVLEWVQLLSQQLAKETCQDLCQRWVTLPRQHPGSA